MAQYPMGGFFGRPRQNYQSNGQFQQFPQMPGHSMNNMQRQMPSFRPVNQNYYPQQNRNVPRGTFPSNFGANHARMPHLPANIPPQIPQHNQGMPPMHLLNPTNDPNVRFEPIPNGTTPPGGMPAQSPMQAPQVPSAISNAAEIIIMVSNLTQGESNSITFYENMAKSPAITKRDKELVEELLNNKRKQMENLSGLYRGLTNSEWAAAKDMKIEETRNYRADIAYALLQESRLLREASQIYANLSDVAHQRVISSVLHSKVADIAHLMSL